MEVGCRELIPILDWEVQSLGTLLEQYMNLEVVIVVSCVCMWGDERLHCGWDFSNVNNGEEGLSE